MALRDVFIVKEATGFTQSPMQGPGSGRAQVKLGQAHGAPQHAPPAGDQRSKLVAELTAAIAQIKSPAIKEQFKDAVKRLATSGGSMEQWNKILQLAKAEGGK